jgi:hypothetical protein
MRPARVPKLDTDYFDEGERARLPPRGRRGWGVNVRRVPSQLAHDERIARDRASGSLRPYRRGMDGLVGEPPSIPPWYGRVSWRAPVHTAVVWTEQLNSGVATVAAWIGAASVLYPHNHGMDGGGRSAPSIRPWHGREQSNGPLDTATVSTGLGGGVFVW